MYIAMVRRIDSDMEITDEIEIDGIFTDSEYALTCLKNHITDVNRRFKRDVKFQVEENGTLEYNANDPDLQYTQTKYIVNCTYYPEGKSGEGDSNVICLMCYWQYWIKELPVIEEKADESSDRS